MNSENKKSNLELALFDFGGVIADEGFKNGLMAIAEANGIDPWLFYSSAAEMIADCGYLTGDADEKVYWQELRKRFDLKGSNAELGVEIFSRFIVRDWMLDMARKLRSRGVKTAILSDQTDWLDRLNEVHDFYRYFDRVFNSYYLKQSKHNGSEIYDTVLKEMNVPAEFSLFVDDNERNIQNAAAKGMHTILYKNKPDFLSKITGFIQ